MWPAKIVALFDVNDESISGESEVYGAFNALLDHCFPWEEGWSITPPHRLAEGRGVPDPGTIFAVARQKMPVFFLTVKPAPHISLTGSRASADWEMRKLLTHFHSLAKTPILHACSAVGLRLCHYKLITSSGELLPSEAPRSTRYIEDVAPAARWNIDILSEEGSASFLEIVAGVKSLCEKSSEL